MTRFLSVALQAEEPFFRLGLKRLEHANGYPNTDIRLTSEVNHEVRAKLLELGLDPHDTTTKELYRALQERVKQDDATLAKYFRTQAATHISAEAEVVAGMVHVIKQLPDSKRAFALKGSSFKSVIKKVPPKKAMKQLGYRSLESFLKHESPVHILAAASLVEGSSWHKKLLDQYKKLTPADFESRTIQAVHPDSAKWRKLANTVVAQKKHNLISLKELGALVFLPLPASMPQGTVTVSFSLALHELNEIRASSTFLKLSQVKGDFGQVVSSIAGEEPKLNSQLLDQPVPWHLIQRYYARLTDRFREEVFGPHLQLEDMVWHPVEQTLAKLDSSFSFWSETAHLGFLDGHKAVSMNLTDTALNLCNQIPYEKRVVQYFQNSLWHELMLRYLNHEPVEESVLNELQPQLAEETVAA
jgi:hypothetical protein